MAEKLDDLVSLVKVSDELSGKDSQEQDCEGQIRFDDQGEKKVRHFQQGF